MSRPPTHRTPCTEQADTFDADQARRTERGRLLPLITLTSITVALCVALSGCAGRRAPGDVTGLDEQQRVLTRQSTPTEIQASVMAFSDSYSLRAADVFDRVYAMSPTPSERLFAREAKVSAGLGALLIATEVNPVASMVDMVTFIRLKGKAFRHVEPTLTPESAQLIRAMHDQSETEVWELAGRFLSEDQCAQLCEIIDEWYANNPDVRQAGYVRLQDFTAFRRESPWRAQGGTRSVLRLLHVDPLAGMDPVAREIAETRMFAERMTFFAKRIPPLAHWQFQLATAELVATPEARDLLATAETFGESSERFATSTERFTAACESFADTWKRMPQDMDQIVTGAIADLDKVIGKERSAAIEQSAAAISAQREGLVRDIQEVEGGVRGVIGDLNTTLVHSQATASAVTDSARDAVESAQFSAKSVVDHIYRRVLILLLLMLIGIPAIVILYRYVSARLFAARPPLDTPPA